MGLTGQGYDLGGLSGGATGTWAFAPSGTPAAWWDASQLTGLSDNDPVITFTDQSGNSIHLAAPVEANRPVYNASGTNSLPTLTFNGNIGGSWMNHDTLALGAAVTLFMVYKPIGYTNGDRIIDSVSAPNQLLFYQQGTSPHTDIYRGAALTSPDLAISAWGIMSIRWDGASGIGRLNGGGQVTGNVGATAASTGFSLGSGNGGVGNSNIEVAEIIVYNGSESFTANEAMLATKWGI